MSEQPPTIGKEEVEALAKRCWRSPVEFCRVFLPDWFPSPMPWVHRGILAVLSGRCEFLLDFGAEQWRDQIGSWTVHDLIKIVDNFVEEVGKDEADQPILRPIFQLQLDGTLTMSLKQNTAIMMPRGFSKTTVVNASNLMDLVYKNEDFFLYVSESGPHASRQLGTLKAELEDNDLLRMVFGELNAPRQSPLKWTDDYIEPTNGVMVGCVGRGGQIRGFNKKARRPGKITYDDLQDTDSYRSETQRKVDHNWFFQTALPTVRKGGRSILIGTLLGSDSILASAMLHPEFTAIRFGAVDRQGDALWAWHMDLEALERKKAAFASVGELTGFYLEYMSEARTDESRMFPSSLLVYMPKGMELFAGAALAHDPAISDESSADFAAFAAVGIERNGCKHVIDFYAQKGMDPAAAVDKFFEFHRLHLMKLPPNARRHGIEAIGYQRALIHLVQSEMFKRSQSLGIDAYFEIMPIFHGKVGKIARVQGMLKPLLAAKYLTFEHHWPDLTTQFLEWPGGKKDGPDVVAMAITLLDPFAQLNLPITDEAHPTRPQPVLNQARFRSAP